MKAGLASCSLKWDHVELAVFAVCLRKVYRPARQNSRSDYTETKIIMPTAASLRDQTVSSVSVAVSTSRS